MKKKFGIYMATVLAGIVLAGFVFIYKDILSSKSLSEAVLILSDGFLLSGVMIFGVGLLIFVSNNGVFDIIVYGVKKFNDVLKKEDNRDKDLPKSFYDYRERNQRKSPFGFMLLVGGIFLLLAILFNILFYFV